MSVELEKKIIVWANERGLYEGTTVDRQIEKLQEETEELWESLSSGTMADIQLELGDVYVVMVNIAAKMGLSLEVCGWLAYEKIRNRTGKMVDGTFVKDGK